MDSGDDYDEGDTTYVKKGIIKGQLRLRRILKDKDKENKENDHPRLADTNLVMRMRVMQMGLRWI